jgi:hypothetical protein
MFRSKANAEAHAKSAHKKVRYPCPDPKCQKVFRTQRYVAEHVKRVHPTERPEPRQFPCPVAKDYNCPQRFHTTKEAKRHARTAHKMDRITCPNTGCPLPFLRHPQQRSTRSQRTRESDIRAQFLNVRRSLPTNFTSRDM